MGSPFFVPTEFRRSGMRPKLLGQLRFLLHRIATGKQRRRDPIATRQVIKRLSQIDFDRRFDAPERAVETIRRFTIRNGGDRARDELETLRSVAQAAEVEEVLSFILNFCSKSPEKIVQWVRRTTVHVSCEPSIMEEEGARRPFSPIETLLSGIGQCTSFSILAAALIEAAGYEARLWAVHGHTYLEWRRPNGRWQMEDPDLLPPEILLPRGMSVRSLLENYHDWRPLMASVPMHNAIEQIHCYVPTGESRLLCWQARMGRVDKSTHLKCFSPGFVHREMRDLSLEIKVSKESTILAFSNRNSVHLKICISGIPFDMESNPYNEIPNQQDLLIFNTAHDKYVDHFRRSALNMYVLIPPFASDITVDVASLRPRQISVFTMPVDNARGQPYIIHWNIRTVGPSVPRPEGMRGTEGPLASQTDQVQKPRHAEPSIASVRGLSFPPFVKAGNFEAVRHITELGGCVLDVVVGDDTAVREVGALIDAASNGTRSSEAVESVTGAIGRLPYTDSYFDTIRCRGANFLIDLPCALKEFHRVLKPGGQVYISCTADDWNLYQMLEPGRERSGIFRKGLDALYNTAWRRHGVKAIPLLTRSIEKFGLAIEPIDPDINTDDLLDEMDRHLSAMPPEEAATVRRLELHARHLCGEDHLAVVLADMLCVAAGKRSRPSTIAGSQAWQPEEFTEAAASAGFADFEWWSEAGSRQTAGMRPLEIGPQVEVRAASADGELTTEAGSARRHFRGGLTVWHSLFNKPSVG